jgi:hypothetical protein
VPDFPLRDRAHCRRSITRREHPIERRGCSASLKMTEHNDAALFSGETLYIVSNHGRNSTKPRLMTSAAQVLIHFETAYGPGAFSNDDDREVAPLPVSLEDLGCDLITVERNFRNLYVVGAAR